MHYTTLSASMILKTFDLEFVGIGIERDGDGGILDDRPVDTTEQM